MNICSTFKEMNIFFKRKFPMLNNSSDSDDAFTPYKLVHLVSNLPIL